jgi:serine/threonine-protein kinase
MIGQTLGNYRIDEQIGRGGMGVVFKATDLGLDRLVAIKMLPSEFASDPQLIERFRGEAKAQATLNHPNIAGLYTFFQHGDNYFMVMEFVSGKTIADMIRQTGPIPFPKAIPWFKQALLGIGIAHRRGIIHRDIKPNNLMVNDEGMVKVMDFGIARAAGGRRLTGTGVLVGTLPYMSPEQIMSRDPDIRSDIYALGVTLYEMVTGRIPFDSPSDFQLMKDIVETPPPPPRTFYPYIPDSLQAAILRAIEKDPNARFQSVEEFGAGLEVAERTTAPPMPAPTFDSYSPTAPTLITTPRTAPIASPSPTTPPGTSPVPSAVETPAPTPSPATQPVSALSVWLRLRQNPPLLIAAAVVVAVIAGVVYLSTRSSPPPPPIAQGPTGGGGSGNLPMPGTNPAVNPTTEPNAGQVNPTTEEPPNVPVTPPPGKPAPPTQPSQTPPSRTTQLPPSNRPPTQVPVPANSPPAVSLEAVSGNSVRQGQDVKLYARVSDPDGDQLHYIWRTSAGDIQGNGPSATLDTSAVAGGRIVVTVTVDDGHGHSVPANETITVTSGRSTPPVSSGGSSYVVVHDHGGTMFANNCTGTLQLLADQVVFRGEHGFEASYSQLRVGTNNKFRWGGKNAFHIKTPSNFNFMLQGDRDPGDLIRKLIERGARRD